MSLIRSNVTVLVGVVFAAMRAHAFSTGITSGSFGGGGCNDCHSGGTAPVVELSGSATALPNTIHTYRFRVSNPVTQQAAGLNVSALEGVLAAGGRFAKGTKTLPGAGGRAEVTHSAPKAGDGTATDFSFTWAAPAAFASVTLDAWGNAVNKSGTNSGDRAAMDGLSVSAGSTLCPASPAAGCLSPGKSSLAIKVIPGKQSLKWRWGKGATTDAADFGTPGAGTDYALCLYADSSLKVEMGVEGGAAWAGTSTGFKFKDKLAPDLQAVKLTAGPAPGKAKIQAKGTNSGIGLPGTLPFTAATNVVVQLVNSDNLNCWEDTYGGAEITANATDSFKAKAAN